MKRPTRDPGGAWYGVSADRYRTLGAEVFCEAGAGWYARCGKRMRGPLSCLDAAITAADRMLDEAREAA